MKTLATSRYTMETVYNTQLYWVATYRDYYFIKDRVFHEGQDNRTNIPKRTTEKGQSISHMISQQLEYFTHDFAHEFICNATRPVVPLPPSRTTRWTSSR